MENHSIVINGLPFPFSCGEPTLSNGLHSGNSLSGIELVYTVGEEDFKQRPEALFDCDEVEVQDPFANRTYQARIAKKSESYHEGKPDVHYVIEVNEIDRPPEFQFLEINGRSFPIFKYKEDDSDGLVFRYALLKLSREEFDILRPLIRSGAVHYRRIGVDPVPIEARLGKWFWSKHEDSTGVFFKQIVRLIPPETAPSELRLCLEAEYLALADQFVSLLASHEALVRHFMERGVLDETKGNLLLKGNADELVSPLRKDRFIALLSQTFDAEEVF